MEGNTKLKTLYILDILMRETDENHTLTATDLINKLYASYGITAERKSIYADIARLGDYQIDIVQVKGSTPGYYIASREFELPELKLLVDAVQSSKFITKKKSDELIKKLEGLTSKHNASELQRQVYTTSRVKTDNETIYYNVDEVHRAIHNNKQITFQYYEWNPSGKMVVRHDGQIYKMSPWALVWDDEYYYLVAYDEPSDKIKYFRVDKMKNVALIEEKRLGKEHFKNFDVGLLTKKTFRMFQGNDTKVSLLCENNMAGVIIDRFGKDAMLMKMDDNHFKVTITVSVSEQFFGWLTGLGTKVKMVSPKSAVDEYRAFLQSILDNE